MLLTRSSPYSAGYDIFVGERTTLPAHSISKIRTTYRLRLCLGFFGMIVPKGNLTMMGLDVKVGIVDTVSNDDDDDDDDYDVMMIIITSKIITSSTSTSTTTTTTTIIIIIIILIIILLSSSSSSS